MFSIIYGGASGAMQSFHRSGMKQYEKLRIVAYVRTLDRWQDHLRLERLPVTQAHCRN